MNGEQFLDQILKHAYETGSFNSLNLIEQYELHREFHKKAWVEVQS